MSARREHGVCIWDFISDNRAEIDRLIVLELTKNDQPHTKRRIVLNDEVRRGWILNYSTLYNWARESGVHI